MFNGKANDTELKTAAVKHVRSYGNSYSNLVIIPHTHTHMHTHTHTHTHTHYLIVFTWYVYICMFVCGFVYVCGHIYKYIYIYMCVCVCVHVCACMPVCVCVRVCGHACVHVCMHACVSSLPALDKSAYMCVFSTCSTAQMLTTHTHTHTQTHTHTSSTLGLQVYRSRTEHWLNTINALAKVQRLLFTANPTAQTAILPFCHSTILPFWAESALDVACCRSG